MIKALSLAACLALLPLSAAVAAEARGPSEDALEAAAEAFEVRMEAFGARAEAISEDASLTEEQRELRIAALWAEYQPDVTAFTAEATRHAGAIASEALAEMDLDAIVAEAQGVATNGAWASNDPEHMATYGLVAEYAVGEALDSMDEAAATAPAPDAD